jgi:hypothetical protein
MNLPLHKLTLTAFTLAFLAIPIVASADISISAINEYNRRNSVNSISVSMGGGCSCLSQSNTLQVKNSVDQHAETGNNSTVNQRGEPSTITSGNVNQSTSILTSGGQNYAQVQGCFGGGGECSCAPRCEYIGSWDHMGKISKVSQGKLKSGVPITDPIRTDPSVIDGAPDDKFFSLGVDGSVLFIFKDLVFNKPGNDIALAETTFGVSTYPEETSLVEVSRNGKKWFTLGTASNKDPMGISEFDLSDIGLSYIKYIRITDTTDFSLHENNADGYDLDALMVMRRVCQ